MNGTDPTQIVARADKPLLIPELEWETCSHGRDNCQVPMVVFSTGLKPIRRGVQKADGTIDEFYVIYGGADSDVGLAQIQVTRRRSKTGDDEYSAETS